MSRLAALARTGVLVTLDACEGSSVARRSLRTSTNPGMLDCKHE